MTFVKNINLIIFSQQKVESAPNLLKSSQEILLRFKGTILPRGLTPSVKILLALFYISIFTVGADLCKEMAKGEFEIFEGILTETVTVDTLSYLDYMTINPHFIDEVIDIVFVTPTSDVLSLPRDRSPPQS